MGVIEDALQRTLPAGEAQGYLVGFSGGLDSTVLLHAVSRGAASPVRAVHVHHGLHPDADRWERRCRAVCAGFGVVYSAARVALCDASGCSLEAAARAARYAALFNR